ncbi:Lsr2 family protein [Nocardia brasiliensis]|uniref:Lsr2 family protein n=2 Tax=Nocardia brasiliensis TaxID=37326 RepID=A0A6G9Y2K1_NOCBR|nr:Lsr2 family protein [Nocardia brasiliensis]
MDDGDTISPAHETVSFSLDGVDYHIDLSRTNAHRLRATFQAWIQSARRVGAANNSGATEDSSQGRRDTFEIRIWARKHGMPISNKGRIATDIMAAFNQANDSTANLP